ncbi:MAG: NAD(P)/FAD-dependent oxidoreductase [Acidobacteriota bacterium]
MARVVVLGAGIAGHTAASYLRTWLDKTHEVVVVSPQSDYNWVPSNIWLGLGLMTEKQVTFPLAPVYRKAGIRWEQARAMELHPEGSAELAGPHVVVEKTASAHPGERSTIAYDFLVNATGPKLNFAATEGLGPGQHTLSVCTPGHAVEAAAKFLALVERMKKGDRCRFVVGTGHGQCTCEGAAFEYVVNLEFELRRHGVRDRAEVIFLTNEYELGDFGMDGAFIRRNGYITPTNIFTESVLAERDIWSITRAHVRKVEPGRLCYETLDGSEHELTFDMAMLLPPFAGVGLQAFDRAGQPITSQLFAPNGFMKVDADYTPKPYEEWKAADWPRTYQSPRFANIFAAGIAFAPPHPISRPHSSPKGTPIFATAPRTGMPSATMGRVVARSIADKVMGIERPLHAASMAELGAACVASSGASLLTGTAASMTVFPIVPDYDRYPKYGRDLKYTTGEIGLAGHWIKLILHYMFLYKARLRMGWRAIPE